MLGLDPTVAFADNFIRLYANSDKVAVIDAADGSSITYKELDNRITHYARYLWSLGVRPKTNVVLVLPKSIDSVVLIYAVLQLGAAYVPVDPESPVDRIMQVVEVSTPSVILSIVDLPAVNCYQPLSIQALSQCQNLPKIDSPIRDASDLAYIIFTSGSTGVPKGVQIPHSALLSFLRAAHQVVAERGERRFLSASPIFFDAFVFDLFHTLAVGGTLILLGNVTFAGQVTEALRRYEVTDALFVSSLLKMLVGKFSNFSASSYPHLKSVWYGGEACPIDVLKKIKAVVPSISFIHGYGPTESTHSTTLLMVRDLEQFDGMYLPLGWPLAGVKVCVVDGDLNEVKRGETGELLIGGRQLMAGYINDFDWTPFVEIDGEKYYRSNDLVKFCDDVGLIYIGRKDDMVKVRGFLVHLSEIENVASKYCADIECYCFSILDNGENSIRLYVVTELLLRAEDLLSYLSEKLPAYMIPSEIIIRQPDSCRYLPSGKLDRKHLKELL